MGQARASITIAGREIGPGHAPYIICELSANHNGDIERQMKLIAAAAATGCDAIKIQTYTPDTMTIDCDRPEYRIKGGTLWDGASLYSLYAEAQTPYEWHPKMFELARKLGVTLFSTPFDETAVDLLASLDAPAYKIASFEAIDLPLIAYAAKQGRPLIISTGMANLGEIGEAIGTARGAGSEVALLHCVSSYPAPIEQANVATIPHLAQAFDCVAGLSDHTPGSAAAVASIALGGSLVEKHFTLSRADGGPDAAFSMEPHEFKALVDDCRNAWKAIGRVSYDLEGAEKGSLAFRRSICAVADIKAGEALTRANVRSIRPGFGLPPKHLARVLGMHAVRDIARGEPLDWSMIK